MQSLPQALGRALPQSLTSSTAPQVQPMEALVPEARATELVPKALAWASLNGLVMGDRSIERSGNPGVGLVHAPFALLPIPFSKSLFQQAIDLSPHFNTLVDQVSQDEEFLRETLARTRKVDSFTDKLLKIHAAICEEGIVQDIRLGLHRSDYMCDTATGNLLQVELNTISSSFAGLGSAVSRLHRYLVSNVEDLEPKRVPQNSADDMFGDALGLAWKKFGDKSAVVLFVVQPDERNMYDQYWLEMKLFENYGATVVRKTLTELSTEARIGQNKSLLINGRVVSVVYFRSGYSPNDYFSDAEWDARLILERSSAIKCPSISYHLVGTKKVQQELAKPGVVERFIRDEHVAAELRKCFAGLWSLEGKESMEIINKAIQDPHAFVLKPQREGGGNNTYGVDVSNKLTELLRDGSDGLAAYILMQRIFPPTITSYLVRGGKWSTEQTVSELGVFGAYLRNKNGVIMNKPAGHLLRTKVSHSNEGGVATGFAVLDSVYLS